MNQESGKIYIVSSLHYQQNIKQKTIEKVGIEGSGFTTIDGQHDPSLVNTNIEWMQENMNPVDYKPRKDNIQTMSVMPIDI